ncbi:MAG: enoyl-ACP reductase [Bacteroidetes bacterium HGW-Bacteroidetes-6]|jgi:enoyl-[acyl-carrier protein] reductase I|nr:MAG: enoyl-ACP reductase [Bacteroidetes bacterium HGW-Bacteroidetes-6]
MSFNLLKNKRGIIFGALDENSIAWQVALKAHEEKASFTLTNTDLALRKGDIFRLAELTGSKVIAADVTSPDDLETLIADSVKELGGKLDFILHSVGMSPNVRKNVHYTELNYDYFHRTLDISAMSLHKVLAVAKKLDAINEYGSVVTLSYIGAQRQFSSYSDMSQAKAMLESIVRSFGYHYGHYKKVRVNSISQSPTQTTAGKGVGGFDSFYAYSRCMSPLGNATSEECAEFCMLMFSDYSRKVTMQNIFHDGGFSNMGISDELIGSCFKCSGDCDHK